MNVTDYMKLPYNIVIKYIEDESGKYYFARVQEFDGCMSHGYTPEEAAKNIREAMELWIEMKLENGYPVPLPEQEQKFSGRFMLRLPKSLHAKLSREADREGVSLNQYALYKLSSQ
jgi:predicted RNase H-like HicB family nuclease